MDSINQGKLIQSVKAKEINLKEYYLLIKKRLWILIVLTILTTAAGYFYNQHTYSPLYSSSTRIIIGSDGEYMKTLMVMIKDPIIMEIVKEELDLPQSASGLAGQISVARIEDSRVVQISVVDSDPTRAAAIANKTASVFKSEIVDILSFNDVQLLSDAKVNPYPVNATGNRLTMIGFAFGIIISIGLIFLLDSLDGTVKKESEAEEILGVPIIGVVSNMNRKKLVAKRVKQPEVELRSETVGIK